MAQRPLDPDATGKAPRITLRLPELVIERIDAHAAAHGTTRSEALRALLTEALGRTHAAA
jgi:predicted DNA binding CopG/RHH family protein